MPDPAPFDVDVRPDRERVTVMPIGELDLETVDELEGALDALTTVGFEHIVLDLHRLTFIDSTGINLCIRCQAAAEHDGWNLSLVHGPAPVRRVFELTGLAEVLPFAPSPIRNGLSHRYRPSALRGA